MRCRQMGKPVIVASHLLQSMIEYPTPTRAEVCLDTASRCFQAPACYGMGLRGRHCAQQHRHGHRCKELHVAVGRQYITLSIVERTELRRLHRQVLSSRVNTIDEECHVAPAQVADIADVVRQRADALMLSGESAVGAYPEKALAVLRQVSTRIEEWCRHALRCISFGVTCKRACGSLLSLVKDRHKLPGRDSHAVPARSSAYMKQHTNRRASHSK